MLDGIERLTESTVAKAKASVATMNRAADEGRDRATAAMVVQGKEEVHDFDVFLCHNSSDKESVRKLADRLRERGVLPWLDERELRPGKDWLAGIESVVSSVKAAAIIFGPAGFSPWHQEECRAFQRQAVERNMTVIPVILSDVIGEPQPPEFLKGRTWVDFRKAATNPLERLIWGITGERAHNK